MNICEGPECGRPTARRNLCATHAAQMRRHGKMHPIRKRIDSLTDEEYIADREFAAKRREEKKNTPKTYGPCESGVGCDRPAEIISAKLCRAHYNQRYFSEDFKGFTPLKAKHANRDISADTLRCNTCGRLKPRDEFYLRPSGCPQSECKYCAIQRSRINQYIRNGDTEAADALRAAHLAYIESGKME